MSGRQRDHLDEVFDRYAEVGQCGALGPVRPEPFGQQDACKRCWDDIIGGE